MQIAGNLDVIFLTDEESEAQWGFMSIIHGKGMTGFLSKTNMPYGWMGLVLEAPGRKSHTWRERPKAAF